MFNYLENVKIDWRNSLNERNMESLLCIKVEGPDIQEPAEKIYSSTVKFWWGSKEQHTTQRKFKNDTDHKTKQKQKRFTNAYIDEFLGNIRSTGNSNNDSDGERSDDNIDVLID